MCLAIYKPKGVELDHEFIRDAILSGYTSNRDGFGFAIKRGGEKSVKNQLEFFKTVPKIGAGSMSIHQCIDKMLEKNIGEDDEVMIHLRMGTSGEIIDENTHPFVCNENTTNDNQTEGISTSPMIIHNGVFSRNSYDVTNPKMCDTYHVAKQFFGVPIIPFLAMKKENWLKELFYKFLSGKVCYMSPNSNVDTILLGNWPCQEKGIFFSNGGYKYYTRSLDKDTEKEEDFVNFTTASENIMFQKEARMKKKENSILGIFGVFPGTNIKCLAVNSIKTFMEDFDTKLVESSQLAIFERNKGKNPKGSVVRGAVMSYHYINPGVILITNSNMKCLIKVGINSFEHINIDKNYIVIIESLSHTSVDEESYDITILNIVDWSFKYYARVNISELLDHCDFLYYCSKEFNTVESTANGIRYNTTIASAMLYYFPYVKNNFGSKEYLVNENSTTSILDEGRKQLLLNFGKRNLKKLENDEEILNYKNWSKSRYKKFKHAVNTKAAFKSKEVKIKLNDKIYGPFGIDFVEKLIAQYEKSNSSSITI